MKKYIYLLSLLVMSMLSSCESEDKKVDIESEDTVAFILKSTPVYTDYPLSDVIYSINIASEGGLKSVTTYLDGVELDGTALTYEDAPKETDYYFKYTLKTEESGQTLCFTVEAETVSGVKRRMDYSIYVLSAKPNISIELPSVVPSEVNCDENVEFDVNIKSEMDIVKITTLKDDTEVSVKTTGFTSEKSDVYHFVYTPVKTDIGRSVKFTFIVTDSYGNDVSTDYSVNVIKSGTTDIVEVYNLKIGMNKCTTDGPYLNGASGEVYKISDGEEKCQNIDLAMLFSNNAKTKGVLICSANADNMSFIYGAEASVTAMGGNTADVWSNWSKRKSTVMRKITMTSAEFSAISSNDEIVDAYNNATADEINVLYMLKADDVIAYKTEDGVYGLIHVIKPCTGNTGACTVDMKIIKN